MYIEHSNITQESFVLPLNVSWTFSPFAKSTGEWPKNTKTNMKQREKWPNTCVSTRVIPVQSLLERSNLTVVIDKSDVSSVIQQDGRDFGVTSVGLGTRQEQDVRTWVEPISDIIIQNGPNTTQTVLASIHGHRGNTLFCRAATSILSQRLLHKMTNSRQFW